MVASKGPEIKLLTMSSQNCQDQVVVEKEKQILVEPYQLKEHQVHLDVGFQTA
jgi:hypothetical protein